MSDIPASVTSERSVLSQVLDEPEMIYQVRGILGVLDFTEPTYRDIYALMVTLSMRPKMKVGGEYERPFDPEILRIYFGESDSDGHLSLAISTIMSTQTLFGTVGAHIDILKRQSYRRRVKEKADLLSILSNDKSITEEELEAKALSGYRDLRMAQSAKPILDPDARMVSLSSDMDARERGEIIDIKTGYRKLDEALGGGYIKGTFNVITAQTGGFKSTFATSMARRMAHYYGYKVLVVSIEMPDIVLSQKDIAAVTGIGLDGMRNPKILSTGQKAEIAKAVEILRHSNYYTWAYSGTVEDVRAVCQEMQLSIGLDVVVVDYLQILSGGGSNLYQEVSAFSGKLREMAKDLNVACITLAQMNRGIFGSPEMLPHISMLKDSGSIENDSASIIGLYWPWAVSLIPGHYVPDDHTPFAEVNWRTSGATRFPTLDSYRGIAIPPTHELQAIVMKNRLGTAQALVRLGVIPTSHDVFCPFISEDEHMRLMREVLNESAMGPLNGISVRAGWTEDAWLNTLSNREHTLSFDGDISRRALVGNQPSTGNEDIGSLAIEQAIQSMTYGGMV